MDIDAAKLSGDVLLRDGACRQPEARPIENEQKNQHAEQADQEHEQQVATNRIRGNVDHDVVENRRISHGRGIGGMDDHLVDEEQRAYRGHQRRQRVVYWYKTEAYDVYGVADRPGGQGGGQKNDDCRRIDKGKHGKPGIGAGDRGRGISHVQLAHGAEDQGEADADQRIGGTEQQPVTDGLGDLDELDPEVFHALKARSGR